MPSVIGDAYKQAVAAWNARPVADRLRDAGFVWKDVDGAGRWDFNAGDGSNRSLYNSESGSLDQAALDRTIAFDGKKFFDSLGIVPLNPDLTGNGDGRTNGYTPETSVEWDNLTARSYKFPDYDALLKSMTGPGQYVDDDVLGRVWVPANRNSQSWNLNFISATSRGGGVFGALNRWADNGGLVTALAGGVVAMSGVFGDLSRYLSDLFTPAPIPGPVPPAEITNFFDEVTTTEGATFNNVPASTLNAADYAGSILPSLPSVNNALKAAGAAASQFAVPARTPGGLVITPGTPGTLQPTTYTAGPGYTTSSYVPPASVLQTQTDNTMLLGAGVIAAVLAVIAINKTR